MNLNELETREASARKLVTGFAPIQIIAVNPDHKKLKEMLGTDEVKEPNYIGENNTRIDFWYTNHPMSKMEFRGKFAIWVSNNIRLSKTDKKQYIDNFTKTVWATNLANVSEVMSSWEASRKLDMKSIREAKEGEENIYNLMKAYANASPKTKPFVLDDFNALVRGNGSELEAFFDHFNKLNGGIKVLLGVKEGKYQDVFTGVFLNVNGRITDYVTSRVVGEYGYKGDYQNSYDLKEFDVEAAPSSNEVETSVSDMFGGNVEAVNPFANTPSSANTDPGNPFLEF
jgi:hypothetical protein